MLMQKGKLVLAAAGTAPTGLPTVAFPANLNWTTAITGLKIPPSYPGALTDNDPQCNSCFWGEEVDFAYIFQDPINTHRKAVAVTCDGDLGAFTGGSSTSTASFAGIAALVWSRLGVTATKDQVLIKLQQASSNPTVELENYGHGWVNTYLALTL